MSNNDDAGVNVEEADIEIEELNDVAVNNSNQINEIKETDEVIGFKETYSDMQVKKRKTIPVLTKYEKTRVVGKRAMQISKGAPPLVDVGNLESPVDIALKELRERKIPYIIRRPLPNGTYEDWRVDELRLT